MNALLDALAGWGPSMIGAAAAVSALLLVVGGFGLGVAHGTASAVAYSATFGVVVLLAAIAFEAMRAPDV